MFLSLFVCLLATLCKNFQMDLYKIFREGWQRANEQVMKFLGDPDHFVDTGDCFPYSSLSRDMESG